MPSRCVIVPFLLLASCATPPPAPAPVPASPLRTAALTIGQPPLQLGGTLTLPAGAGPFPTALLVAGSGPHDRDETIGVNKPFRDLAEGLAAAGVASFRYDKRTLIHPRSFDPVSVTVEQEVIEDALAALAVLRRRPEVAPGRLVVVGHSLGALLAPEIAARAQGVAAVVLLAAPARPLPSIVIEQARVVGVPAPALASLERQAARVQSGEAPDSELFLGAPASYWRDLARRDARGAARALGKPVLVLRGARDYQVTDEDQRLWQEALAGVKGAAFQTFEGLNHLFIAGSGTPGPTEYQVPGRVAAAVIDRIAAFVRAAPAPQSSPAI